MTDNKLIHLFPEIKPIIGMVHLGSLPGYESHPGMKVVIEKALADVCTLQDDGCSGILVENDNDQPHQIGVSEVIENAFVEVMRQILKKAKIPVGMEIIYDMRKTVEVAKRVGASFVRLDVFVDEVETKWGRVTPCADEIDLGELVAFTDVQVKHAKMVVPKTLEQSVLEAISKGSSGVVITGDWTGEEPKMDDLVLAKRIAKGEVPIIVGSGFNKENAKRLLIVADGVIVGSSIKTDGKIDSTKTRDLVNTVREIGFIIR